MKLDKKSKDILQELVKGKGYFKTPTVPKDHIDKKSVLDLLVPLYLKGLLTFQRQYDIPLIGPSNEHKVRYKWYDVMIDKKKTIKDLQTMSKDFDAQKRESMNRTIKGLEKEIEKIMSIALDDADSFEKGAGGVSFGGHGTNPELFNIKYGKKKREKDD